MDDEETLSNEFATVTVQTVDTRNGRRLEIRSPKLGRSIRVDPLELESLTWQDHSVFSEMLEAPFGPEEELDPDELDRPHR